MSTGQCPEPPVVADVLAMVGTELGERAVDAARDWWTRYLKGEASFRGAKMADTRAVAQLVDRRFGLDRLAAEGLFELTDALLAQPYTEDKLVAVLLLGEIHLARIGSGDVDRLAGPLLRDELADWNSCDWYCIKLLGPFIEAHDTARRASAIADWVGHDGLWVRRAAAVAFVPLASEPAPFDGFAELVLGLCERNVADATRWSQTSVGWVLRELSVQEPGLVRGFVDAHADSMTAEARRAATKRL